MEDKRLIDANARIEEIKKAHCTNCDNYGGVRCRACWVDDAIGMIDDAHTVDAAPVVHGQWVAWYPPMHMIMTGEEMLYRCSACDAKYPDVEGYRFCPRCGTIMDGGADHV